MRRLAIAAALLFAVCSVAHSQNRTDRYYPINPFNSDIRHAGYITAEVVWPFNARDSTNYGDYTHRRSEYERDNLQGCWPVYEWEDYSYSYYYEDLRGLKIGITFTHPKDGPCTELPLSTLPIYPPSPQFGEWVIYSFFSNDNPEILIKVLDGCDINGNWWVYASAATDLEYEVVAWRAKDAIDVDGWDNFMASGSTVWKFPRNGSIDPAIADTTSIPCD